MKYDLLFFMFEAVVVVLGTWFCAGAVATELYGADALGRMMPDRDEAGPIREDKYVGIFYFLWLDFDYLYDVSSILEKHPGAADTCASPPWGPPHAYHFWGEPLFGYYRSHDPWVLRRHAIMLADAGVDFLVFDATNAVIYEHVLSKLFEVFERQRQQGENVPQVTFMLNTRAGDTAQRLYEIFYKPERCPRLWFRWEGKPLLICDPAEASAEIRDFFTLRKAHWPFELVNTRNEWHWEATYPQVYSYDEDKSRPEQVSVSVGQNLHQVNGEVAMMSSGDARGRSFHDSRVDDRPQSYLYGFNFEEQWQRAYELDPEIVFITGWNEWVAMQLNTGGKGPVVFCDQFNLECSRDVEMMKGGYGDNYYMQMAANIRRFKGMSSRPQISPCKTVRIDGPFDQWDDVTPEYRDHTLETLPRDFPGCGDLHYKNDSGRNDFKVLKVAHDEDTVYFYAETREPVTAHTDANWMWLLIDVKGDAKPDWEGFNFLVNRNPGDSRETSVEICVGGWNWHPWSKAAYRVEGRRMHIAVPKADLGISGNGFALEFKWVDNTQNPDDIMDLYVNGDAAPGGRFRFRYDTR